MQAFFKIGDREYGVDVVVVEPFRAATRYDPSEGELAAGDEVDVYERRYHMMSNVGSVPYDEFIRLLQEEYDEDLRQAEARVQRALWEAYHEG